ncbi:hemolysin III family protein [Virgibacillus xinjiangensis]|uniref:Hemolysin III family protein n=1 Tax=Virgibacillus xinjiangensis TaxID=393090 RepID=A0ABV7CYV4_9BACI
MKLSFREPVNALTHLFGAIFAAIGLFFLIDKAAGNSESAIAVTSVVIFGISMILLYAASATYHSVIAKDNIIQFLRKIDHSMIYVLIAGTYTPFCLIVMEGTVGWVLFLVVSTLALLGVLFKLTWFHSPRWLSTALYVILGWIVVFFSSSLAPVLGSAGMLTLFLGGVFYTVGALIYWLKPNFLSFKHMGFHEIFHVFILFGSLFHFICIYWFVL